MDKRKRKRFTAGKPYKGRIILAEDIMVKNISESGLCLETFQRVSTNRVYRIQFQPSDNKKVMLTAQAVWSILRGTRKENEDVIPVYEVGLKFLEMSEIEKQFLEEFIQRLSSSSPETEQ